VKHVTIRISGSAWKAHQRHGDSLGACTTAAAKKAHSKPAHVKKFHGKNKKK
jgi:mRNA-degrading endonuclease HigB of HigAB toxin-antitoxin module